MKRRKHGIARPPETAPRTLRRFETFAAWTASGQARILFQLATVTAAATTIAMTWPLWQVRAVPLQFPLLPLPQVAVALPLLATLVVSLARPRLGLISYSAVLAYAVLTDQTRIQPQFLTFGFLLAAATPGTAGLLLARLHLVVVWLYAGLHKLLSVDFMTQSDPWMLRAMVGVPSPVVREIFPWVIVSMELGAGLLVLSPRTRRPAVAVAVALHLGILVSLMRAEWNPSVWPWNALCALAAVFLIFPWQRSVLQDLRAAALPIRLAGAAMAIYPLGFYVGWVDTYLSYSLYAMNEPRGFVCNLSTQAQPLRSGLGAELTYTHSDGPFQCRAIFMTGELGAPLPPLHRLFKSYFVKTCQEGEFLLILERRRYFVARGQDQEIVLCSDVHAGD